MRFLLDTNVFSEIQRGKNSHPQVQSWWAAREHSELFLSVLVMGEVRRGIARIQKIDPGRARKFESWLNAANRFFAGRILVVDSRVADMWGRLTSGRSMPLVDSLLAATAICHGMTLVTRNTRDIRDTGVKFLNPFEFGA